MSALTRRPFCSRPAHTRQLPRGVVLPVRLPLLAPARSGNGESEAAPRLSLDDAYKLLDVKPGAGFEEVLQAKNRKMAAADGDMQKVMEIESAYDLLFMQSMKRRLTGEIEVSTSVRYADVQPVRKQPPQRAGFSGKAASRSAPTASAGGLSFAAPTNQQQAATQAAVFTALGVWGVFQAVLESPEAQMADTAGLQMALALGYSIYTLKENKRMELGKAVGISFACLFAGALLGTALQNWLRVDIVPLGSFSSPGVFCTEFAILFMALGSLFLV